MKLIHLVNIITGEEMVRRIVSVILENTGLDVRNLINSLVEAVLEYWNQIVIIVGGSNG